ncbi:hypothetical protein F4677DRAFT_443675 [Hypoxylon crocopeplum]|nr:hypothetical protein F4677DRAFT_443675 [Hypoxylon crocopeplum]
MAPLKVLIVGGGVVGPALAYWLARVGANITLIERASTMRASGQQVDLRAQGVPMMKKMGIEAAVRAAVVHEIGTRLIDRKGRTKAFFAAAQTGSEKQSFSRQSTRSCAATSTTIDSFTQDDESDPNGKVHVSFQDGRKEDFDLVVGADGTGSKTRRLMLGPDAPDPRHALGGYIAYYSIPSNPGDSNAGTFCHLPGKVSRAIGTRKDNPELTRVYMLMHGKDAAVDAAYKSGDLAALKKAWADLYQGGGWECDRFTDALRHAPEADDLYCTPFEEVRLPEGSWSKGRVALVGDSAYCQTAGGFGCTWGLGGSYVLAGEIAAVFAKDTSAPTAAVVQGARNYEKQFRPIATANHEGESSFESLFFPKSSLGIWCLHSFARIAALLRLDQAIAVGEKTAKWRLPDYPELEKEQVLA